MAEDMQPGQPPTDDPKPDEAPELGGNTAAPSTEIEIASEGYWTVARMEQAQPIPLPTLTETQLEDVAERLAEQLRTEEPQAGSGNLSLSGAPEPEAGTGDEAPTATSGGYNYPGPFTRHEPLCMVYPYVTVGKIFFSQRGINYVGSAASIGNYAFFSAGHCVHDGSNSGAGWSKNLAFVPAYRDGNAPYGIWRATKLWTRTIWYQNGIPNGLKEDMGGGVLLPLNNRKISQVVGWLGFAWNWSKYQHWHSIGYPAASPFNGNRMWDVQASFAYNGSVSTTMATGNDMTGGCSGGPWIWRFGTGNYLNGVNSYRNTSRPSELCSPYFGNAAKSLKDTLVKATP
jgi:V8-like Glu-specific endopeptidase